MAIDRNTVIREAQKLASKGQFDKAIAEWRKLVKETPNDANIFNTIGDLCLKKNAKDEAVEAYQRAADLLAEDGFTSKAIALYKKVLNIDPGKIDIHLALGAMNADKGLTGNALESYKVVADHYKKKNDMVKALGIYQKMADLNPANVAFRMKLAEMYIKEGMQTEAVQAYLDASDQHMEKGAFQDARQMFEKVLALNPNNKAVYHKAGIVYFKEGKFPEACKALKPAFESDPGNHDLVNLYLEALEKAGRAGDAEEVYKKLLVLDPSRQDLHERLYQSYLGRKDYDKALKEAVSLAEHKAESMDFAAAAGLLKEFIAVTHDPLAAAVALGELFSKLGRATDGGRELVSAADMLSERGSTDDAREVLGRAGLLAPDLHEVNERLEKLSGAAPKKPEAPAAADLATGGPAEAVEELAIPEAGVTSAMPPAAPAVEESDDPAVLEALTEVDVLVKYGLGAKAVEQLEGLVRRYPEQPKVRVRLLDLYREQQNTMKAVVQALMLADLYEKKGRDEESRSVLRAALELAPGNPQIIAKLGLAGAEAEPEAPETIEEPEAIEAIAEPEAVAEVPELSIPSIEGLELVPLAEEDIEELQVPDEEATGIDEPPADSRQPEVTAAPEEAEEISFGDEVLFEEPEEAAPPQRGRAASAAEPRLAEEEPSFEQPAPAQETVAESDIAEIWAEAEFYYQQGLFDEARKYYEKVLEVRPGERRAMERIVEIARDKEEHEEFSRLAEAVEGLESTVGIGPEAAHEAVSPADAIAVRSLMQEINEMRKGQKAAPPGKVSANAPEPVKAPRRKEPEESFAGIDEELQEAEAPTKAKSSARPSSKASEESFADIDKELQGAGVPPPPAGSAARGTAGPDDSGDFFDLAAELRDELSASPAQKTAATAHEQSLDEIFEEFKAGVEAHEKKEDEDTHYNLGVAYREMGLFDDAISEFNMTNEGEPKFIQSRYMLGLCYLEQGDYETAITEIQNALGYSYSFGEASEERLGMHYDLGLAFQGVGNSSSALEEFQKVFNLDPAYRDVETKIQELQQGDVISMDTIKEDIEKEISFKFLEEGARIEREEKTKRTRK